VDITEQKIAGMLRENTGRHMLDSGGAYGRNWERNQVRDFSKEQSTSLSFRDGYINVTHNLYHWLKERLTWDEQGNRALHVLNRWMRARNFAKGETRYSDRRYGIYPNEFELSREFPEFFRAWKARRDEQKVELVWGEDDGLSVESPYDLESPYGGDGRPCTVNTYNEENLLSQTIQFTAFTLEHEEYVVLHVHGGCDVRGGYTMPQVFTDGSFSDCAIFDYGRGSVYCTGEGPFSKDPNQLDLPGAPAREDSSDHYWVCDGGGSWGYQAGWGGKLVSLEDYDMLALDDTEDDSVLSWQSGKLCYVESDAEINGVQVKAGTGFCPHCGGILAAGF
jgi:hypothetical protein